MKPVFTQEQKKEEFAKNQLDKTSAVSAVLFLLNIKLN